MAFIKVVEEQSAFKFTGRINLLLKDNNQFKGHVLMNNGKIVNASFGSSRGLSALLSIVFEDVEGKDELKYIVEPEIVAPNEVLMNLAFDEFQTKIQKLYEQHKEAMKLKPPGHLKLLIDSDFIVSGSSVEYNEFQILENIVDNSKVDDIYNSLELNDFEITNALVSLKKKKALKVLKK